MNKSSLQKWFLAYVILSFLLFCYLWDYNFRRRESLELILVTHLLVISTYLIMTIFFCKKITQESLVWCISRALFGAVSGMFITLLISGFFIFLDDRLRTYLIEYPIYGISGGVLNGFLMLGAAEQKEDELMDVLDDNSNDFF